MRSIYYRSALALSMMVTACGEADRTKAEAGASWLTQHRLFRPFGKLGEISKVVVDCAKMIRMEVDI
jgi:hypothetical protein